MTADDTPARRARRADASDTHPAAESADPAAQPATPAATPAPRRAWRPWLLVREDSLTHVSHIEGRYWTRFGANWHRGRMIVAAARGEVYPPTRYTWILARRW